MVFLLKKVEGEGFLKLIQEIVNVIKKYKSPIDVKATMPKSRSISNNVSSIFNIQHAEIIKKLRTVEYFGVTTDMWTDNHKKSSFMAVTIHYISDGELKERILAVRHFESPSATGINIRLLLIKILEEYELKIKNFVFVSDRGANVVAALKYFEKLSCIDHVINNVLEYTEKEHTGFKDILTSCKALSKFFKKANLQQGLKTSIKCAVNTRWNSNFEMIDSIIQNTDDIRLILTEKNKTEKFSMSVDILIQIRDFLKSFKTASDIL